jgi:hypothetical protein
MTANPDPTAQGKLAPEWLAHRYDEGHDAIHLVRADRAVRGAAPFLIDEHLDVSAPVVLARADALQAAPAPAPAHFIFHSAYCCSTLLANALDIAGVSTSLKEPQILNDMVGWRQRGADPARVGEVLAQSLHLLARPFQRGECVVIKPSNVVNGLASAMMRLRPDARAILLYAPLRSFLASIARKGMWGRLWVRELLSRQLVDGLVDLGFEPRDHLLHTDLQAAAVGWLAQQRLFAALAMQWPDRVRTLDSEVLVARPAESLAAASSLFALGLDDPAIARIVREVFSRDAKDGKTFAPGQREAERRAGEAMHAEEIDKVAVWAESVAANAGVAMVPPCPLIS